MPVETPPRAFISYRTDETLATASRLAADLALKFGPRAVFLDHSGIRGGEDWCRCTFNLSLLNLQSVT